MGSAAGGTSDVPEPAGLPHTRARATHWITTAAALAAVVAAGVLIDPPDVSASPSADGAVPVSAPDPGDVKYPIDCAGAPIAVAKKIAADLDGDGRPETAAAVHCQAGGGTPPHALFILSQAAKPGDPPRIVARLDNKDERVFVTGLEVRGRRLVARISGYSSADVPGCCPDLKVTAQWEWTAGGFTVVPRTNAAAL